MGGGDLRAIRQSIADGRADIIIQPIIGLRTSACYVFIRGGSCSDPKGRSGMTHLLEHLMTRSTRTYPGPAALTKAIADLGADLSAGTVKDFLFIGLRGEAGSLPFMLKLLAEMAWYPAWTSADVRTEKRIVLQEIMQIQSNPDPFSRGQAILESRLWGVEHPMGLPVEGVAEECRRIRYSELVDHHQKLIGGCSLLFTVAGGISSLDIVVESVAKANPSIRWPRENDARLLTPSLQSRRPNRDTSPHHVMYPDGPVYLFLGWVVADWFSLGREPYDALAEILAGADDSRLYTRLRERAGLLYEVGARAIPYRSGLQFMCHLVCSPRHLPLVAGILSEELSRLTYIDDQSEVDSARRRARTAALFRFDNPDRAAWTIGRHEMIGCTCRDAEATLADIDAVTPEMVSWAAMSLQKQGPPVVVVLGPKLSRQQWVSVERISEEFAGIS